MADRNWFNCIKHFLCCSRDLFIVPNQQKCWQTLTKFNERLGHTYSTYISIADSPQFFADQSPHKAKIFLKSYAEEFPEMCSLLWEYSEIFYFCFTFSASYRILLLFGGGICSLSFLSGGIFNSETSICCSSIMVLNTLWKNSTFPSITYFIYSS